MAKAQPEHRPVVRECIRFGNVSCMLVDLDMRRHTTDAATVALHGCTACTVFAAVHIMPWLWLEAQSSSCRCCEQHLHCRAPAPEQVAPAMP